MPEPTRKPEFMGEYFDEQWYLEHNPDVAQSVRDGGWQSGFDHYNKRGKCEGRAPGPVDVELEVRRECCARTGMEPKDLVCQFASFGNNCEFGFVQRHFGAEPISIFRFSNPQANMILHGVRNQFVDLGTDISVELDVQKPRREWILIDRIYRLRQHTFIFEGDPREQTIQDTMRKHLAFLKRQLLEDIMLGNKIFVIKSVPNVPEQVAREIAVGLREQGSSWLLWTVDEPGGPSVERIANGLLKARVNGLLPEGHPQWQKFAWVQWLKVMTQAWVITR